MGGDWNFPVTAKQMQVYSQSGLYLWTNIFNLFGVAQPYVMYPVNLLLGCLWKLGISGEIFNKALLLAVFTLAGCSMYSYCRFLKLREPAAIVGGLFFITTPIFFDYTTMGWAYILLSLALLPLALKSYTKAITEKNISHAIVTGFLFTIAFFLASQSLVWYAIAFIIVSFFVVRSRRDAVFAVETLTISFFIFFLMNTPWIIPALIHTSTMIASSASATDVPFGQRITSLNLLRLWGSLYNYQYESAIPPILLPFTFVPVILAYLGTLIRRKDRMVWCFVILSFVPLLMFLGRDIYYQIPFTQVIRDYSRFIYLSTLAYSVLIAMTIDTLISNIRRNRQKYLKSTSLAFIFLVSVLAIALNSYPFWTGELYGRPVYGYDIRLRTLEFPGEYYTTENMLAKEKDSFKALYLPMGLVVGLSDDQRFSGIYNEVSDLFPNFSPMPGMTTKGDRRTGAHQEYAQMLESRINANQMDDLYLLLSLANVKYVVVRRNTYTGWPEQRITEETVGQFEKAESFRKIREFNSVVVFENTKVLSHIYPAAIPIYVNGGIDEMLQAVSLGKLTGSRPALFLSNQLTSSQWNFAKGQEAAKNDYAPKITFRRVNPTKYEVRVKASQPFFLVFSESFHPGWEAYVENSSESIGQGDRIVANYPKLGVKEAKHEMVFTPSDVSYLYKKPISDDKHFMVNGYANAWFVDPKEAGGEDFTITLYYKPQSYFYLGLGVSIITFLSCIGYLIWYWWKRRKPVESQAHTPISPGQQSTS